MRSRSILFVSLLALTVTPLFAQEEANPKPPAPPARLNLFPEAMYLARPDLDDSLHLTAAQKAAVAAAEPLQLDATQRARVARVQELHALAVTHVTEQLVKRLAQGAAPDEPLTARIAALLERKPEHLVPECKRLLQQEDAQSDEALLRELEQMQKPSPKTETQPAPQPGAKPPSLLEGLLRATTAEVSKAAGRELGKALGGKQAESGAGADLAEAATRALLEELLRKPAKQGGRR